MSDAASASASASASAGLAEGRHLVLIGLMGAGKSTVGPVLAEWLGRVFVDLDDTIVQGAGRSIADIFASRGEAAFRDMEHQALTDVLAARRPLVLAVGGGCAAAERNHAVLGERATVVWLQLDPEVAAARVGEDPTRPLLGSDAAGTLRRMADERADAYREVAHVKVPADAEVEAVADKVLGKLSQAAADLRWAGEGRGADR